MKKLRLFSVHSLIGIIAAIPMLLMGVSGSILVFHEEIDKLLYKNYLVVESDDTLNLDVAYQNIHASYPEWEIRFRKIPTQQDQSIMVDLRKPGDRLLLFVHPQTGSIIKEMKEANYFTIWLLKFHYSLFMGFWGKLFVFISGILFVSALVSGFILYRKSIVKVITFRLPIKTKNIRTYYSSLHRIVGTWGLIINLVLAVSGAIISFVVFESHFKNRNITVPNQSNKVEVSLNAAKNKVEKKFPDLKIVYTRISHDQEKPILFYGSLKDDFWLWSKYANVIGMDRNTGEIASVKLLRDQNFYDKFMNLIFPLHFGSYGGILIKIIYALAGLSPSFLAVTGFYMFLKRRNRIRFNYKNSKLQKVDELVEV